MEGSLSVKEDYGPDSRVKEGDSFGDPVNPPDVYSLLAEAKEVCVLLTLDKKAY